MRWIGTSGYSYPEWKGGFYPANLSQANMFAYYVERFPTVEINNTFYRLPDEKLLEGWASVAPARFRFSLKAPQKITHQARLKGCEDILSLFLARASTLGDRLGVLLFQLPPYMKKDTGLLGAFLALLPQGTRAALELRHVSWHDDQVFALLRRHNVALCITDSEKLTTPFVATADFGYLRLPDEGYEDADLLRWHQSIVEHEAGWRDVFVYFKHEGADKAPTLAAKLDALGRESGA